MTRTGTGIGGSGGIKARRVARVTIDRGSHMLLFENVQKCARMLAPWANKQICDVENVEQCPGEHDRTIQSEA